MNIFPYKRKINKNDDYCVYLTIYSGKKLPPFYIGSSTVDKVNNGYHGSITSKKWKYIYFFEISKNPHLFKTIILRTYPNRNKSLKIEKFLQKKNNVVKSNFFFNESLASINGMFGRDEKGHLHPQWKWENNLYCIYCHRKFKQKIMINHVNHCKMNPNRTKNMNISNAQKNKIIKNRAKWSDESKIKITGDNSKRKGKIAIRNLKIHKVKYVSEKELIWYLSDGWEMGTMLKLKKIECKYCGKKVDKSNHTKWHGENCKFKSDSKI